ncbi:hypothetical protein E4K64_09130 [Bradyrhizobium frederickii]|uniref:Uncharacterized protein n=1 Tax=Bradyrhizobium frederickii TaxID=2560054 RepID=A0A4Y9PF15_9BRAD|nr:hypothetical protein [Bradyrhizobium frederickii]TFV77982.1 hypothetical protein E4K64_09130 [Bradyrhizobium frederickii]
MTANRIVVLSTSLGPISAQSPPDPVAPMLIKVAAKIRCNLQARLSAKPCIIGMVIPARLA